MALTMRKDIKKSSYYVWFLGAQECKGLRGRECVEPAVRTLVQREREVEPFKVTLQVSHKGMKIIQNVPPTGAKPSGKAGKPELVKHFIPHNAVTCVSQDEDIVACILLLYNPVTKCPVHVHAYRCDSVDTADILRGQLQTLVERPENQKKISEIEIRLRSQGLLPASKSHGRRNAPGTSSDGRGASTRGSESSGGSSSERLSGASGQHDRISTLYDSLAAELREKLGVNGGSNEKISHAPLLLPPRDYDTVHRQKGRSRHSNVNAKNHRNLAGGPSPAVVSSNPRAGVVESSGGSSGIGSDHAPSPEQDRESDPRFLDNPSSSDEDWNEHPSEDSLFLVQPLIGKQCGGSDWKNPRTDLSLPRARHLRGSSTADIPAPARVTDFEVRRQTAEEPLRSPSPSSSHDIRDSSRDVIRDRNESLSPQDRFRDAKEKFLLLERERLEEQERLSKQEKKQSMHSHYLSSPPISPTIHSMTNSFRNMGNWSRACEVEEIIGKRPSSYHNTQKDFNSLDQNEWYDANHESLDRHGCHKKDFHRERSKNRRPMSEDMETSRLPSYHDYQIHGKDGKQDYPYYDSMRSNEDSETMQSVGAYFDPPVREQNFSPQKRHVPSERIIPQSRQPQPAPRFHLNQSKEGIDNKTFIPDEGPRCPEYRKKPTQLRTHSEPLRQSYYANEKNRDIPLERYRSPVRKPLQHLSGYLPSSPENDYGSDKFGPESHQIHPSNMKQIPVEMKRHSMFEVLEEERRRSSNEIAREFKRRSRRDERDAAERERAQTNDARNFGYYELAEHERYPGLDRDTARLRHHHDTEVNHSPGITTRYRHSYAEPGLNRSAQPPHHLHHHEILHRTNSSVSSGRVGIASLHPY